MVEPTQGHTEKLPKEILVLILTQPVGRATPAAETNQKGFM